MAIPHTHPSRCEVRSTQSEKLSSLIQVYKGQSVEIGLLGVPDDRAVIQGKGRAGAALGPDAIRRQLAGYGTSYNVEKGIDLSVLHIADFGDLVVHQNDVEKTHQDLSEAVSAMMALGVLPILFGGGHDLTFAAVRGMAAYTKGKIGGIAIDAHFDVRETVDGLITSGTPFRNILDHINAVNGRHFVTIGANGLVNTLAHLDYLNTVEAKHCSLSELRKKGISSVVERGLEVAANGTEKIFCSIDLDAIAQAFAPGVSAPSSEGLSPEEVSRAAYLCGLHEKVSYFDIMELNPNFDPDGRTARLAVTLLHHFLAGLAQRKLNQREKNRSKNSVDFQKDEI